MATTVHVGKWTACPAVELRVFWTDCYMLINLLNGPSGPETCHYTGATITLYPIGRPVRATITLYPIRRPVRATITLYPIGRLDLEL